MAAQNSAAISVDSGHIEAGFAKLQGENFVYYMQKYSITLGRSTETSKVDFDLCKLGGARGSRVSHHHARIFYDFGHHHFALEVLGKTGCTIRKVSYLPGSVPVKLNSKDSIEIAGKTFYFLLPACSIFDTFAARRHPYSNDYGRSNGENSSSRRFTREPDISNSNGINADSAETCGECDKDTEDQLLLEKDVVSSLVVLIPDLCSPGEWVPMEKLYSELLERFGKNWVRRYLPQKDGSGSSSTETEGRPWCSLLQLLRKYPEHFIMGTVIRGEVTSEFVALVSLGNGP